MTLHSKIGASTMERWSNCPGSVNLCKDIPTTVSVYAEEGTRAHEIAAKILSQKGTIGAAFDDCDDETQEAINKYIEYVFQLTDEFKIARSNFLVEHKFDLSEIHPGLFGTADCVVYQAKTKTLNVIDYKHGAGIAVDATENLQLMYYGLGALMTLRFPCREIVLTIVQPRAFHSEGAIRSFKMTPDKIIDFSGDLKEAALKTEDPKALLVPGDHCRFCPASGGVCPALKKKAQVLAKTQFDTVNTIYSEKEFADLLTWLPVLESFIKNARAFAYSEACNGRPIPGWKLVAKRATRRWNDADEKIAEALECILPDQESFWSKKLKSPAQVEKLLGKQKIQIQDMIISESSGYSLAPEKDRRPAVSLEDAKNQFTQIEEKEESDE